MPPQRKLIRIGAQAVKSKGKSKVLPAMEGIPEVRASAEQTAASLSILEFSAAPAIQVDDQNIQCYSVDINESTRVAKCFVESQAGKSYRIILERGTNPMIRGVAFHIELHLDGDAEV
ncbi:hypothetical protein FRC03_002107 [Tulasnella sp. 419]|nr:hypothetical protein FRC03_002107 [Tulasnella sp. 419]